MIEYAVKTTAIPIPFHKLLKVVALVDAEDRETRRAARPDRRREVRDRGQRPLRPRRLRGRRGRRLHRVDRRRPARAGAQAGRAVRERRFPHAALGARGFAPDRRRRVLGVTGEVDGYIYLGQQTPAFYAKQVIASLVELRHEPAAALLRRADGLRRRGEHRLRLPRPPGRQFYRKSPAGQLFFKHFGEQIFRNDLCNADVDLGDLLIHEGAGVEAQRHAAQVFGADQTYFVLNGTSTSNKVVTHACCGAATWCCSTATTTSRCTRARWSRPARSRSSCRPRAIPSA